MRPGYQLGDALDHPARNSRERPGRYRWVAEREVAWLDRFRRLLIRYERRAQLDEVLSRFLAPRERAVLCLLVGYPVGTPLTLTEVADQFGITPDMVKRIQATALAKLRSRTVVMMLRDCPEG